MNSFLKSYDRHEKALGEKGFDVIAYQDGLTGWRDRMMAAGQDINRSFNPDEQPGISPSNTLWLECRSHTGVLAAFNALRVYDGADLRTMAETGALWWSPAEALANRFECLLPASFPAVRGRLFQLGGLFVCPEFRKSGERGGAGIGRHLTAMGRAAGFSIFQCNDNFGLEKSAMAEADDGKMPLEYFGYARCEKLASDVRIGAGLDDFYLTHISQAEALDRLQPDQLACP